MADILIFPAPAHVPRAAACETPGVLLAMRHVDLDEAIETVLMLRESGRSTLLDDFNRGPPRLRYERHGAAG